MQFPFTFFAEIARIKWNLVYPFIIVISRSISILGTFEQFSSFEKNSNKLQCPFIFSWLLQREGVEVLTTIFCYNNYSSLIIFLKFFLTYSYNEILCLTERKDQKLQTRKKRNLIIVLKSISNFKIIKASFIFIIKLEKNKLLTLTIKHKTKSFTPIFSALLPLLCKYDKCRPLYSDSANYPRKPVTIIIN